MAALPFAAVGFSNVAHLGDNVLSYSKIFFMAGICAINVEETNRKVHDKNNFSMVLNYKIKFS
jgi:hypothetical protein